jgi:undecaprenyl-phosphate galactose phosphotransferase
MIYSPFMGAAGKIDAGDLLASIPVPRQLDTPKDVVWQWVEAGERVLAAGLLVLSVPVMAVSATMLAVLSRRTPWIAHRRVGWRGSTLWVLKLRTMWGGAGGRRDGWIEYIEDSAVPEMKQEDPRVTSRFARFCRRHSIDELPQLWHVVRGEMSLVGPRPVTEFELRQYFGAEADEVLQIKPGIAGLWQTEGRSNLTWNQRRALDLLYVRQRSVGLYLRILAKTLPEVWQGSNGF